MKGRSLNDGSKGLLTPRRLNLCRRTSTHSHTRSGRTFDMQRWTLCRRDGIIYGRPLGVHRKYLLNLCCQTCVFIKTRRKALCKNVYSYFARRIIFIYYSKCFRMAYRHNKLNNLIRISPLRERSSQCASSGCWELKRRRRWRATKMWKIPVQWQFWLKYQRSHTWIIDRLILFSEEKARRQFAFSVSSTRLRKDSEKSLRRQTSRVSCITFWFREE